MQIHSLNVHNWKGVEDFHYEPKKVNILLGPNGSGKTSLLEAVKCGISGKTPPMHVKAGTAGASIDTDIDKIGTISRSWNKGKSQVRLNHKVTTQKSVTETISDVYGCTPQTTNIMSSTEILEGMFGKDFAAYLLGFIRNDMDVDKLVSLCTPSVPGSDFERVEQEIRMYFPEAPNTITLEDMERAYQAFRESRAAVKASIVSAKVRAQYAGPTTLRTMSQVENDLDACTKEQNRYNVELRVYNQSVATRTAQNRRAADLEGRIAAIHETMPTTQQWRSAQELAKSKKALHTELISQIAAWRNTRKTLLSILSNLEAPVCPISKKLVCTTDKSGLVNEVTEEIDAVEKQIADAEKKSETVRAELAEAESELQALSQRQQKYQIKQVLIAELEALKKEMVSVPAAKPDPSALEALRQQIGHLQGEKRSIEAFQAAQAAERQVEAFQESLKAYETLITLFAPDGGVRQKVLEHNIAPLQDYCNSKISSILPKYTLRFDVSNGFDVYVEDASGNEIAYGSLSAGERLRVMYLLTDMLNALNGFRILILDNLDGLDEQGLRGLCKLVKDRAEDYDHIFLAAVNTTEAKNVFSSAFPGCIIEL